jgi:hypothetical protein
MRAVGVAALCVLATGWLAWPWLVAQVPRPAPAAVPPAVVPSPRPAVAVAERVLLMWTTPPATFQARHWLVLHSYLYQHPDLTLVVYATHLPEDFFVPLTRWGYRVELVRIDDAMLETLATTCPGGAWLDSLATWRQGPYFYSHLTDFLRFCLLYRSGGVYSDMDALLLQPLDALPPAFIGQDRSHSDSTACPWCLPNTNLYLAPGVMAAPAGAALLRSALEIGFCSPDGYRPEVFNAVGPQAITAAYNHHPAAGPVVVLEPSILYPLPYWRAHELLAAAASDDDDNDADLLPTGGCVRLARLMQVAVSLHLFGHMTGRLPIERNSVVACAMHTLVVVAPIAPPVDMDGPEWALHGPADYVAITGADGQARVRGWRLVPGGATAAPGPDGHGDVWVDVEAAVIGPVAGLHVRLEDDADDDNGTLAVVRRRLNATVAEANAWLARLVVVVAPSPAKPSAGPWSLRLRVSTTAATMQAVVAEHSLSVYDVRQMLTVMVKTTGRIAKVVELLRSLRARYPTVPVIVADDGEHAHAPRGQRGPSSDPHFVYLPLPFDVGLSAGRNAMVDLVTTPYVLTLDDDFVLDAHSVLEELLHVVATGQADVAAGRNPVDEDLYRFEFGGLIEVNATTLALVPGHRGRAGGGRSCRRVDIVPNLFVARTDRLRTLRWDPALKLGEHEDFFLRAQRAGWVVASCPTVSFVHQGSQSWFTLSETSSSYDRQRARIHQFWEMALRKHGLVQLISFGTVVLDLRGPAPVGEVSVGEVLPNALTVYWAPSPWATKYELAIRPAAIATAGATLRGEYASCPVLVIDLAPDTAYTLTVFALIAHVRDPGGRSITVRTRSPLAGTVRGMRYGAQSPLR